VPSNQLGEGRLVPTPAFLDDLLEQLV
jgi:hypothetical protein